jgi:hypothetical protein
LLLKLLLLLAAQHVQQVVFTHRLGQRQASVLAARVVEYTGGYGLTRQCCKFADWLHAAQSPDFGQWEFLKTMA